uniref:Fucolectin tachylectin-4 pentraxin-1 domain-containing protein n=1 Tax=Anguilla anguilla TaxID=7936 RepID=A0A0E9Y022_ANGAN
MATGETKTFHCPQPMIGRYVTVYLPTAESLHLCEVEVNVLLPAPC